VLRVELGLQLNYLREFWDDMYRDMLFEFFPYSEFESHYSNIVRNLIL